MHMLHRVYIYLMIALHVSGVTITHLQEHKTTVTIASGNHYTVLLSVAIVEKFQLLHDSNRQQYGVMVTRCCGYSCFVLPMLLCCSAYFLCCSVYFCVLCIVVLCIVVFYVLLFYVFLCSMYCCSVYFCVLCIVVLCIFVFYVLLFYVFLCSMYCCSMYFCVLCIVVLCIFVFYVLFVL